MEYNIITDELYQKKFKKCLNELGERSITEYMRLASAFNKIEVNHGKKSKEMIEFLETGYKKYI